MPRGRGADPYPGLTDDEWLTRDEAADYARCSPSTIDRARRAGKLDSAKRGGLRRFRRSRIDAWLAGMSLVAIYLLAVAFALALVCYCHALHVAHGPHCIWF